MAINSVYTFYSFCYNEFNGSLHFMRIILGIIGIILSFLLIVYRDSIHHFTGSIEWAERKLGPGGTYSLMVVMAIIFFFLSLMYMTNSFDLVFGNAGGGFFQSAQ